MDSVINRIVLITTKGCEACKIANDNILNALNQTSLNVDFSVKDISEVPKKMVRDYKIKDFPTVLYYFNDTLCTIKTGSYPTAVYLRWIDMYFKK